MTTKTSRTPNAAKAPHLGLLSSLRRTCTLLRHAVPLAALPLHHIPMGSTPPLPTAVEQTRYNRHLPPHPQEPIRSQAPSRCLVESQSGSLPLRLVDRLVHSMWILGRQTVAVGRIVRLVRRMFWRCWTTLLGEKVLGGVSRSAGAVSGVFEKICSRVVPGWTHVNHVDQNRLGYRAIGRQGFGRTKGDCCMNVWNGWIRMRVASPSTCDADIDVHWTHG